MYRCSHLLKCDVHKCVQTRWHRMSYNNMKCSKIPTLFLNKWDVLQYTQWMSYRPVYRIQWPQWRVYIFFSLLIIHRISGFLTGLTELYPLIVINDRWQKSLCSDRTTWNIYSFTTIAFIKRVPSQANKQIDTHIRSAL